MIDFYFSDETILSFKFQKKDPNKKKIQFLVDLLRVHYLMNVSVTRSTKINLIDALRGDCFQIPSLVLTKYVDKVIKKEINHKLKPFQIQITFFNLSFHNNPNDLRDQLKEF